MAALVVLAAIGALSLVLLGTFMGICANIRRTDKWGSRLPEPRASRRRLSLAYVARWDDNRPAFA
jgi:hypothetical protein